MWRVTKQEKYRSWAWCVHLRALCRAQTAADAACGVRGPAALYVRQHACLQEATQGSGSSRVSGSGFRGQGSGWSTHPGSTLSHARRCCREMFSAMERHCKVCDRPCAQACQIRPALQHLLGNDTTARLSYCGAFLQRRHSPTQLQRESHIPHSSATPAHTRQLKMDPNARCTGGAWPPQSTLHYISHILTLRPRFSRTGGSGLHGREGCAPGALRAR